MAKDKKEGEEKSSKKNKKDGSKKKEKKETSKKKKDKKPSKKQEKKSSRKKNLELVVEKLETAFADLKASLGEKKFSRNINKAGKLLAKIKKK